MLPESLGGAGLVQGARRHRATARPPHDAHLGQPQQVAPDGLVRDTQHLHEVAATHAAALADEVRDHLEPVGRQQLGVAARGIRHVSAYSSALTMKPASTSKVAEVT